jgi:hypothetical protein
VIGAMCTVSVVPHVGGIRLLCNRDERRTRPAALPPAIHLVRGTTALFPVDPEGGGTWIGVNDAGLAVTLLNTYIRRPGPATVDATRIREFSRAGSATADATRTREFSRAGSATVDAARTREFSRAGSATVDAARTRQSRGLIVRELLACRSVPAAIHAAARIDRRGFLPFRLLILRRRTLAIMTGGSQGPPTWTLIPVDEPLMFTSSSLGDNFVESPRRALFNHMVLSGPDGWLAGQARFHRHRWRSRPEISVVMERPDARTMSRTAVDVCERHVRVRHKAPPLGSVPEDVLEWHFSSS